VLGQRRRPSAAFALEHLFRLAVLLAEPPRTNYDLHFRVLGIPVRVHPFFWLVALLSGAREGVEPRETFIWMAALFVSILVHELGHAAAIVFYGHRPRVTLHWLGGLASYDRGYAGAYYSADDADSNSLAQIVIALAGPIAGFLFAAVILGLVFAFGAEAAFFFDRRYLVGWRFYEIANENLFYLLHCLLFVNVFWGLVNLLPIYPLDGGKVSRELFLLGNPRRGIEWSLKLSMAAAIAMAVFALFRFEDKFFAVLLFGFLAYWSYQALTAYRGFGGGWGTYGGDRYGDDPNRGW
jgi:Zn-dependent protease